MSQNQVDKARVIGDLQAKTPANSKKRAPFDKQSLSYPQQNEEYNVNYPPSIPGSPALGASNRDMHFGDMMMVRDDFELSRSLSPNRRDAVSEHAIDDRSTSVSPRMDQAYERRHTIALQAEEDVCFPLEGLSEMADDDMPQREGGAFRRGTGRDEGD